MGRARAGASREGQVRRLCTPDISGRSVRVPGSLPPAELEHRSTFTKFHPVAVVQKRATHFSVVDESPVCAIQIFYLARIGMDTDFGVAARNDGAMYTADNDIVILAAAH